MSTGQPREVWVLASTIYGEKLRDTDIGISVWPSKGEAVAALRDDFAETYELTEREMPADDDAFVDDLKWFADVVIGLQSFTVPDTEREQNNAV